MSERDRNCKRDAGAIDEASIASVSPLLKKKKKLDDDSSTDSHGVVLAIPASSDDSSQVGCSVTSAGEEDDDVKSSIICLSSEIARSSPTDVAVVDLQAHQISETETSTSITSSSIRKKVNPVSEALGETVEMESSSSSAAQKSPEVSKSPTLGEIEEFLSELENKDQKRFIEKYNFDIVYDKPLQGRYNWGSSI